MNNGRKDFGVDLVLVWVVRAAAGLRDAGVGQAQQRLLTLPAALLLASDAVFQPPGRGCPHHHREKRLPAQTGWDTPWGRSVGGEEGQGEGRLFPKLIP